MVTLDVFVTFGIASANHAAEPAISLDANHVPTTSRPDNKAESAIALSVPRAGVSPTATPPGLQATPLGVTAIASLSSLQSPVQKKTARAVLEGRGLAARVVDSGTGSVLWKPGKGRFVSGMELSPDGSRAKITFAVRMANQPATVIYSVPDFVEAVVLPENINQVRGTSLRWEWISETALLGVCIIEKSKDQLAKLTALERESDLAIESVKLFVYDLNSHCVRQVSLNSPPGTSWTEVGEVRKGGYFQVWSENGGYKWYVLQIP